MTRTQVAVLCALVPAALGGGVARAEDLAALRADIRGTSEAKAVEAAQKLAEDPSPQAMDAILDELSWGASPKVEAELVGGLATRKDPRTLDVLSHYARNRNSLLRKRAINALAPIQDPRVTPLLVGALSDTVADVRAAAARALATRKDRSPQVEDALVKLLAHKDESAVTALGVLGGPATARRLGELTGEIPDSYLANTFSELLGRADFGPDPLRVMVIKAIGKLTGPESTAALKDYIRATENDKNRPSSKEARKLIEQRGAQDK